LVSPLWSAVGHSEQARAMVQTGADHFDGYHDLLDDGRRRLSRRRERAVPPRAPIPQMLAGQLLGHPRRNFGLHGEQILGLAIELMRPECLVPFPLN
jgi:hypothetical protein